MAKPKENNVKTHVLSGFRGALIIGDPSLGSGRRIGRVDDVWDTAVAKLRQVIDIAAERKLVPVIIGDLLHESRDIGQLLPIIQILSGASAILVPKNSAWNDQAQGHIAAILDAAGIAHVAGHTADRFQLVNTENGSVSKLDINCFASWGGVERLEFGSKAYVSFTDLNLKAVQGNTLPDIAVEHGKSVIIAGRLMRMGPSEEPRKVFVYEVTKDGIETIAIDTRPVVFGAATTIAEGKVHDLENAAAFIEQLRNSAAEAAEETGQGSLLELVESTCTSEGSDDWLKKMILELATEAISIEG